MLRRKPESTVSMQATFMSKKRAPYSYIKKTDGAPIGLYRPKFTGIDRQEIKPNFEASVKVQVDVRESVKPTPACIIVARDTCNLNARQKVTESDPVR